MAVKKTLKNAPPSAQDSTAKSAALPAVLAIATIEQMDEPTRVSAFIESATASQRAFSAMGKIFHVLERDLKPPKTIFGTLQSAGVKKGTISNASYAAKVFKLVTAGDLAEEEYNKLSFPDCLDIVRVTGSQSKKRLDGKQVAEVIRQNPRFDEEFACLFEHGLTLTEHEAAAQKAMEQAAASERQRQEATARLEQERERLKQEPGGSTAPPATANPLPNRDSVLPKAETAPAAAPATPAAESKVTPMPEAAPAPVEQPKDTPPPANSTPMPAPAPAKRKATAQDGLTLLQALEDVLIELNSEEAAPVIKRLIDLADMAFALTAEGQEQAAQAGEPKPKIVLDAPADIAA